MKFDKKVILLVLHFILSLELSTATTTHTHTHTHTSTNTKTSTNSKEGLSLSFMQKMSFFRQKKKNSTLIYNKQRIPTVLELREETGGIDNNKLMTVEGRAYWRGWVKYFKIYKGEKPKSFMTNHFFEKQMRENPQINLTEKSKSGLYRHIKDPHYFYITLFKNNIDIANSREDKFKTNYDVVLIDYIAPVIEYLSYDGGIQDFGSFNEGFCFKVVTTREKLRHTLNPKANIPTIEYVFCCENQTEKEKFMGTLRSLKISVQKSDAIVTQRLEVLDQPKECLQQILQFEKEVSLTNISQISRHNSTEVKSQDGRWVILQSWAQCSLKCGGGVTVLHRFCIPHIGQGKPCEGESIIKRPCNTTPCKIVINQMRKNKVINEKPEVRIMSFSNRPQRYIKCKIKESDVMIMWDFNNKTDEDEAKKVMRPARVVMNTFTISFFDNSNYYSNILTFDLVKTNILISQEHKRCVVIQQFSQEIEMCPFSMNLKDHSFIEEWNYDFNLFKIQCHPDRKVDNIEEEINNKLKKKIDVAKIEINEMKKELIIESKREQAKVALSRTITETADLTYRALQRELSLEEMIKNEERQKEEDRLNKLKELIELEKEKKKHFTEVIKEKEFENENLIEKQERVISILRIKKEAQDKLMRQRSKLKKTLTSMKKRSIRQEMNLQTQLIGIRSEIASELTLAHKIGDSEKCKIGLESKETRRAYCVVNFKNDFSNFQKCDDEVDFCYNCCQWEFGNLHPELRKKCYKDVCCPLDQ